MVTKTCCIDLYQGDDVSDNPSYLAGLDQAKKSGIFALIHKSSEGTVERDSRYNARRQKWMVGSISVTDLDNTPLTLPPLWGAYHFAHGQSAASEAKNFLAAARLLPGDLPFLDWEAVGASGFQPSIAFADAFCEAVEQALGRVCGVYGGNVPRERFNASPVSAAVLSRFSKRPFWFAAYGGVSELTLLPEPWKVPGAFLWQNDGDKYGPGTHTIPGISNPCDNSTVVLPMTFQELHDRWLSDADSKAAPPPLPPVAAPETASLSPEDALEAKLVNDINRAEAQLAELRALKGIKK
jgi:GH25 family lysozyme M1 (1,4-beta-N-acetylmuramidase)